MIVQSMRQVVVMAGDDAEGPAVPATDGGHRDGHPGSGEMAQGEQGVAAPQAQEPPPSPADGSSPPPPAAPAQGTAARCLDDRQRWRDLRASLEEALAAMQECVRREHHRCRTEAHTLSDALAALEAAERAIEESCR
jgi:hypothetical protein